MMEGAPPPATALTTKGYGALGIPLTVTVSRAGPLGNPVTSREVKVVSLQPMAGSGDRKAVCPLSRLRSCTTGKLVEESWAFPPEPPENPEKNEPMSVRLPPARFAWVIDATRGCQLVLNPSPAS